jgi:hypothetical protein
VGGRRGDGKRLGVRRFSRGVSLPGGFLWNNTQVSKLSTTHQAHSPTRARLPWPDLTVSYEKIGATQSQIAASKQEARVRSSEKVEARVSNARTQGHYTPEEVRVRWPGFQSIRLPHELWPCKKAHLLGTADASMEVASSPPSVPTSVAAASAGTTPSRNINTTQLAAPARSAGGRRIQGPRRRGTQAGAEEEVKAQGLTSGGGAGG